MRQTGTTRLQGPALFLLMAMALVIIAAVPASAVEPLVLHRGCGSMPIGRHVEVLEDPHDSFTISEVSGGAMDDRFVPSTQDVPSLGFTASAFWLRFTLIVPTGMDYGLFLECTYPFLDLVEVYIPRPGGGFTVKRGGDTFPFARREIDYKNLTFRLPDRPGTARYYLHIKNSGSYTLPFSVVTGRQLTTEMSRTNTLDGLFYGAMLLMILIILVVSVIVREISYVYLCGFIFTFMLTNMSLDGTAFQYLWPDTLELNNSLPSLAMIDGIFMTLFINSFFRLGERAQVLRWLVRGLTAYCAIVLVAVLTFVSYAQAMFITVISAVVLWLILLPLFAYLYYREVRRTAVVTVALLFMGGVIIVTGWKAMGLLPFSIDYRGLYKLITLILSGVFTASIFTRIYAIQQDRLRIQEEATATLERNVADRTAELEIERNRLRVRNELMEREIALARKIQDALIPAATPAPFIAAVYQPMQEVGGDFYDFINFGDTGRIGLFLSDVSGHGVPAAFITSMIKTILLQAGPRLADPADLLRYMNEVLRSRTAGNFVTAFYGIYDPATRALSYANAGHPQPYLIGPDGVAQLQGIKNMAIGMFPDAVLGNAQRHFENRLEILEPGSKLLLYTDGFVEARPVEGDQFFEHVALDKALRDYRWEPCTAFLAGLMDELVRFRGDDSFDDDICLVCLDVR